MNERVEYWHAYVCGHRTRRSPNVHAGIDWCEVCRAYVGVIVQRIENATGTPRGGVRGGKQR